MRRETTARPKTEPMTLMPRLLARTDTIAKPNPSLNSRCRGSELEALEDNPPGSQLLLLWAPLGWGRDCRNQTQLPEMMTLTKFALLGSSPISNSVVVHSDIRLLSLDCPWTSSSSYKHAVRDPRRRKVRKERTFDDGTTIMMSCCCTMSTTCSSAERYVVDLVSFSSCCALANVICLNFNCALTGFVQSLPQFGRAAVWPKRRRWKLVGRQMFVLSSCLLRNLHQQHHQDHQHLHGECITMVEIRILGIQGWNLLCYQQDVLG
jgi:hypothetical protein